MLLEFFHLSCSPTKNSLEGVLFLLPPQTASRGPEILPSASSDADVRSDEGPVPHPSEGGAEARLPGEATPCFHHTN